MINSMGASALFVAFLVALYGAAVSAWAATKKRRDAAVSSETAVYAVFALVTIASAVLLRAFLARDFSLLYVYEYSSRSLSDAYAVTAFWAGQEGSLLLWMQLLALFAALTLFLGRRHGDLMPWVTHVFMVNASFFLLLLNFVSDPFAPFPGPVPADGYGLNPLLQNPGMIWHPPTLFIGYVGLTVPYAFAMASLLMNRSDSLWITSTRRWTVISWFFLGVGILLGAEWAYVELGWGGYWAWDPVENASLMPWLTATAFLHSVMIQERRGMMKIWNVFLIICTYFLVIFGTFITRSGVISSVHAFGKSSLGTFFMVYMLAVLILSFALLFWRRRSLAPEERFDSVLSRESGFLLNNVIFTILTLTVFWGTILPTISELFTGTKMTVGPAFFNKVNTPFGILLLFLIGACPLLGWKLTTADRFRRNFVFPLCAAAAGGAATYGLGVRSVPVLLVMGLSAFVVTVVAVELVRGVRAGARAGRSIPGALASLVWGNRRRYGGYTIHLGMVLMFVGMSGAALTEEVSVTLVPTEKVTIGHFTLTYEAMKWVPSQNLLAVTTPMRAEREGVPVARLVPERRFYQNREDKPTSEVSILSGWKEDLYVALTGYNRDGRASFRILVNPLVAWLWAGGFVMAAGTLLAMWPGGSGRPGARP